MNEINQQPFNPEVPQIISNKPTNQESDGIKVLKTLIKIILIIGGLILLIPVALILFCIVLVLGFATGGIGILVLVFIIVLIVNSSKKKKTDYPQKNYLSLFLLVITFVFLFVMGQSDVQSLNCPVHYDFYYLALPLLQLSWLAIGGTSIFNLIFGVNKNKR